MGMRKGGKAGLSTGYRSSDHSILYFEIDQSRSLQALLARQFDEYIWFDQTEAVTPFKTGELEGLPDTYPFGL